MRKRFVDRLHELRATQHGFTLLELLIGLVIVSILAAIATQYFLHQRRKGWVAQVRASTRNMAGAQNYFVFEEGASGFTDDLDDLYMVGYRWDDLSVRPYVALATNQTYCLQVHSVHDPSIVWHFSSNTGYPQEGAATPSDCGDPQVLGTYIAGLPPASAGRDGVPGVGTVASTDGPGGAGSGSGTPMGEGAGGSTGTGGTGTGGPTGTFDPGSSGAPGGPSDSGDPGTGSTGGSGGTTGSSGSGTGTNGGSGSCDGGTGGGGSSGPNHPSGKDRDTENGGSGSQGNSGSDPDGDENEGSDKPGGGGGANSGDQDGNNGSGNDTDFEDDNQGPDRDGSSTPGSGC